MPASEKLIAWITVHPDGTAPSHNDLRVFLSERLPVYMLPADIGVIDAFPLNPNGKVDVSQLDAPESFSHPEGPLTPTEMKLTAIWGELLDRSSIHANDNWFHIGGHSLLALRLFARIHQEFRQRLPLSAILDHSTPRSLAALIDQTRPEVRLPDA